MDPGCMIRGLRCTEGKLTYGKALSSHNRSRITRYSSSFRPAGIASKRCRNPRSCRKSGTERRDGPVDQVPITDCAIHLLKPRPCTSPVFASTRDEMNESSGFFSPCAPVKLTRNNQYFALPRGQRPSTDQSRITYVENQSQHLQDGIRTIQRNKTSASLEAHTAGS